jgi:hypothetical protein
MIPRLTAQRSASQVADGAADSLAALLAASQPADRLAEATLPWLAAQGSAGEAASLAALLRGLSRLLRLDRSRLRGRLLRRSWLHRLLWLLWLLWRGLLPLLRWHGLGILIGLLVILTRHVFLLTTTERRIARLQAGPVGALSRL